MLHSELSRNNTCTAVYLSLLDRSGSIQTKVGVAMVVKKDFQNIQHPCHLSKDQNSVEKGGEGG